MSLTLEAFGLDRLSPDEQRSLAQLLWARADAEAPPQSRLTDAQREELRRRIADADANPDDFIPWEQVKAETRARLKKS
jgi:putative addiction module component (TIGR02574 family)